MSQTIKICLNICIIFLLTGCIQPVSLGDRSIIKSVYLDYEHGIYTAILTAFDCEANSDTSSAKGKAQMYQGQGDSIEIALHDAESQQNKKPFYAQNEILLLGTGLLQHDAFSALKYFAQENAIRPNVSVFGITLSPKEWLEQKSQMDQILQQVSLEIKKSENHEGGAISLYQLFKHDIKNETAFLPFLSIKNKGKGFVGIQQLSLIQKGKLNRIFSETESELLFILSGQKQTFEASLDKSFFAVSDITRSFSFSNNRADPQLIITLKGTFSKLSQDSHPISEHQANQLAKKINEALQASTHRLISDFQKKKIDPLHHRWWFEQKNTEQAHNMIADGTFFIPNRIEYRFAFSPQQL